MHKQYLNRRGGLYRVYHSMYPLNRIRSVIALLLATGWGYIWSQLVVYEKLLATDPVLVAFVMTAIAIDLVTGVGRAIYDGGLGNLRSLELWQTVWKIFGFATIIVLFLILENASARTPFGPIFALLDDAAYFYVGLTEIWSSLENITGSSDKAAELLKRIFDIRRMLKNQTNDDKDGDDKGEA